MLHAWIAMVMLSVTLAVAAVTDWRSGKVYNRLTYPAIAAGLVWATVAGMIAAGPAGALAGFQHAGLGFVAGFVPFAVLFVLGGLGGGDAKLMGAVGAISASWQCVFSTAVYAFVIAAGMAVFIMIRRGLVRRTLARLWGAILTASARQTPDMPTDSPRVPFAVAIALGGVLAGAEVLLGLPTPWAAFAP